MPSVGTAFLREGLNGSAVPIVVWPDGRIEQGFEDHIGCFII